MFIQSTHIGYSGFIDGCFVAYDAGGIWRKVSQIDTGQARGGLSKAYRMEFHVKISEF